MAEVYFQEMAYFGPSAAATPYFAALGYQAPTFSNPADYFLDILTDDTRSEDARQDSDKRVTELLAAYRSSPIAAAAAEKPAPNTTQWTARKGLAKWYAENIFDSPTLHLLFSATSISSFLSL